MNRVVIGLFAVAALVASCDHASRFAQSNTCAAMTQEEQSFAEKLRPFNQNVFCTQLSRAKRKEAMFLAKHGDFEYGRQRGYSPDAAVERVSGQRHTTGRSYKRSCAQ